jgi:hypothetical protein
MVAAPRERRAGVGQRHALPGALRRSPRSEHRQGTDLIQPPACARVQCSLRCAELGLI